MDLNQPLTWVQINSTTWITTLEGIVGGGTITVTQTSSTHPERIPDCFVASITVDSETFPIPRTEYMKCFDLPQCQWFCYEYWQNFILQIWFNGLPA